MEPLSSPHAQASLLLVQGHRAVGRALGRLFEDYYSKILLADSLDAAEQVLQRSGDGPTHVICGEDFGSEQPRGHTVLAAWRHRYPAIQRAILATGAEGVPQQVSGVDGVYLKPAPLSQLFELLGIERSEVTRGVRCRAPNPHNNQTEIRMKANSPKAHNVATLKDRLAQAAKTDQEPRKLRSAQGFATV